MLDEFDYLITKKQDVIYELLEWTMKPARKMVLIAISNTIDLPDKLLTSKNASRFGLERLIFNPYNSVELSSIISSRISETGVFEAKEIELCTKTVANASGDARRALHLCKCVFFLLFPLSLHRS